MFEANESWVKGALIEEKEILADLLDALGDSVAVLWAEGVERLEDDEVEGSLKDFLAGLHVDNQKERSSCSTSKGEKRCNFFY